jgi:glyoxylase-like metal-dependent hydrolase (beta-lactamase superfamily II)
MGKCVKMNDWPDIPLEDEFGDILRKAMLGNAVTARALESEAGIPAATITAWTRYEGSPDDDHVRNIARVLHLDPGKFADSAAKRWHPPAITLPDVRHHPQDPHPSNGYVFFLDGGKRAALIDPAGIPENLLRILRDGAYHLQYILVTHKHADHCDATEDIAKAFPNARIVMHEKDAHAIGALSSKALHIRDGEELPFGDAAAIRMLHTPGHTDGSVSYLFQSTVFTGDTLFAGSVGGAYGDASTYGDILNSVRTRLFTLPDETVVMPGHGPPSTIAEEKHHNPFF